MPIGTGEVHLALLKSCRMLSFPRNPQLYSWILHHPHCVDLLFCVSSSLLDLQNKLLTTVEGVDAPSKMPRAGLGTQYSGEYFWGTLNTIQRQLSFACSRTSQSNTYGVCVTASKSDFDAAIVGSTVYRVSSPTLEKLAASASIATVLAGDDVKLYFDIHPSFSSGTLMKSFSVSIYMLCGEDCRGCAAYRAM